MTEDTLTLSVNGREILGDIDPIWRSIGYDEINWTYSERGRRLLRGLQDLGGHGFYIRNHNVFSSFDPDTDPGAPSRGGTNCYSEDAAGQSVLDWTLVDRVYDTFVEMGHRPIVEIGFMPAALSVRPPAQRVPPRDYDRWRWLCRMFAGHLISRYGLDEVRQWYFSVWNEPDILFWMPEVPTAQVEPRASEYCLLYDFTVDGLHQACPELRVGGPEIAGPGYENPECRGFLEYFLQHCAHGPNHATGAPGSRLDFISMHGKATGRIGRNVPPPNLYYMIADRAEHYRMTIRQYPQFADLPVLLDEWDIDFGTHSTLERSADFAYRNTSYYPVYVCRMVKELLDLKAEGGFNIALATQWTFYHPDSACFQGRRHLVTFGDIVKPVWNALRMLETLSGRRLRVTSDDRTPDEPYSHSRRIKTVDALATLSGAGEHSELRIILWNQVRDPAATGSRPVRVALTGLPMQGATTLEHYRIDRDHSNAHTAWQALGAPPVPTLEQIRQIRTREGLEKAGPDRSLHIESGAASVELDLPMHGVSLLRISA